MGAEAAERADLRPIIPIIEEGRVHVPALLVLHPVHPDGPNPRTGFPRTDARATSVEPDSGDADPTAPASTHEPENTRPDEEERQERQRRHQQQSAAHEEAHEEE